MMLGPDLRTLQIFVCVAREGNITRAAEQLHLSQPAISLQLQRLARDAGVQLLRRTFKGVELTRDGVVLLRKAEQVLAATFDFSNTAQRLRSKVGGKLRIGTIIDPEFIRLGAFLKVVVESGEGIETELSHGMSGDVLARVRSNALDVGFYLGTVPDDVVAGGASLAGGQPLFQDRELARLRYRVVAPEGMERLVIGRDWAELAGLPWIGTPPASVHNRLLTRLFAEARATQNVVALVDQESSMLEMVRTGVGLSLCREQIALRERQARGLVIADAVKIDTSLRFVCLSARRETHPISLAFDAIERVWGSAEDVLAAAPSEGRACP